ncbi:MAG: S8 family serine peptidase [Patescibacteria group bacterium]
MKQNLMSKRIFSLLILLLTSIFWLPLTAQARLPNDEYFSEQWQLTHIGAPEAWQYSLGMETVTIAIIDSGVDLDHPDLKDNIWRNVDEVANDSIDNDGNGFVDDIYGWDFVDSDADPNPVAEGDNYSILGTNHGTISAGLAAAKGDNGQGIVGITWQVPLMVLRALDSNGVGDPLDVARAVDYAVDNGAKVINLSFVGNTYNSVLNSALRRAYDRGVFVVAAAGNAPEGGEATNLDSEPLYPICFDRDSSVNYIYGVAATDWQDKKATFSNYGASCVDISAPGERLISTQAMIDGNQDFSSLYGGYYSGTSVAAPLVSGLAALMLSLDSTLTPKRIMNIFTETSFNIDVLNENFFGRLGRGRIDAAKSVRRVLDNQDKTKPNEQMIVTATLAPEQSSGRYIVTTPGVGHKPEVRIFTEEGLFLRSFNAFPETFMGGVSLAIGNFDGTHRNSIVTGALAGGGPHVRIFDINTRPIGGFFAYDQHFTGGVEVAVGDLDGDGIDEIITGAGEGGGPHIRMFDKRGVALGGFFAFEANYRGGTDVAAGDLDGDGRAEIVVAPGKGKSEVRVFDRHGQHQFTLLPFGLNYTRGMQVDIEDLDGDGVVELVVRGHVAEGKPETAVYDGSGNYLGDGGSVPDLTASAVGSGSVTVPYRTAWGQLSGEIPQVTVTASANKARFSFLAYGQSFLGGVRAAYVK